MAKIKMHIPKAKLPFYPSYEVKCKLQNGCQHVTEGLTASKISDCSEGWEEENKEWK